MTNKEFNKTTKLLNYFLKDDNFLDFNEFMKFFKRSPKKVQKAILRSK